MSIDNVNYHYFYTGCYIKENWRELYNLKLPTLQYNHCRAKKDITDENFNFRVGFDYSKVVFDE